MKKIKFGILFIVFALTFSFSSFAIEETGTTPTETTTETENATDGEISGADEGMTAEDAEAFWEEAKSIVTNSSVWTMIAAAILTVLSNTGLIKTALKKIMQMASGKADNATLKSEIDKINGELKHEFEEHSNTIEHELKMVEDALKATADNEQKFYAILALFFTNCKIPESAKAEIVGILTGVKKYSGELCDIVTQAQEAIDKAQAENAALASPTPTLDTMLEEEYLDTDYMRLG